MGALPDLFDGWLAQPGKKPHPKHSHVFSFAALI